MFDMDRSATFIEPGIQGDELLLGDVVAYDGSYAWLGQVVHLTDQYVVVLDALGRLARFGRATGEIALHFRQRGQATFSTGPSGHVTFSTTSYLLRQRDVKQAARLALAAPPDPADFDRWMLPLATICCDRALKPETARYYRWPAPERRIFEATLDMMKGERQREVYVENVLGHVATSELRRRHDLKKAAVRTARWRANAFVKTCMGHAAS